MKKFNHFILECELRACEDEELQEGLRKRVAAAALGTALALGGGGAAKANTDISGNVNVSRGAVAAKTTDAKVKSAVSKAIDNPGQSYSASSEKGRMNTTVSGGINVSGRIGGGGDKNNNKEKKQRQKEKAENRAERQAKRQAEKPQPTSKRTTVDPPNKSRRTTVDPPNKSRRTTDPSPGPNSELAARKSAQQDRLAVLQRKNKFTTKYRYAVPTGTGGRFNTRQASGPNQISDFKAVKTNRTGGTNYQRTKVVGDPSGSGGTGRTVSAKRYDKLFGDGGRYAPKGDGSTKYVPSKLGKPFKGT